MSRRLLCCVRGHDWVTTRDAAGAVTSCGRCSALRHLRSESAAHGTFKAHTNLAAEFVPLPAHGPEEIEVRPRRAVAVALAASAVVAIAPAGGQHPRGESGSASCTPAVVAGKRTCLTAGHACVPSLDRRYHRYAFHCHTGRLVRAGGARSTPPPRQPLPPPALPGRRIDVGGYRLYIECVGSGSPTVVFEAGQGGAAASSPFTGAVVVRRAIAAETRVCAYDRAGLGASDLRPTTTTPTGALYARELHALLAGADVPGPYVLVGPSYGGLISTAFAAAFPAETAGLVFVDADSCDAICTYDVPEAGVFDLGSVRFGNLPAAVLVADLGSRTAGSSLAARSTNSIRATALRSGHAIVQDAPQIVTEAIRLVLAAVRTGTPLPACEQTAIAALGGRCESSG